MRIFSVGAVVLALSGSLVVGGCASCTDDPTQAGFACGLANVLDGTYDDAIRDRQNTLAAAQQDEVIAGQRAAAADAEARRLEAEVSQARARLNAVDSDARELRQRLDAAEAERTIAQSEVDALERRLAEAERRLRDAQTRPASSASAEFTASPARSRVP